MLSPQEYSEYGSLTVAVAKCDRNYKALDILGFP